MPRLAVRAAGLSKQYQLNVVTHRHHTLRDLIVTRLGSLTRRRTAAPEPRGFWALRHVSFEVQQGEIVGFVGRNGAGKSTLLKILSRITHPTEGQAEIYGRIGSLLEVGTGFHPELSGRENIYFSGAVLGMSKQEIETNFDQIVAFAEVERFIDTPVKRYSSGMYVRLAFAVAAHLQSEILIVDEVLAVGDAAFQKKCLGKMESVAHEGRTVLFVSHNADAVRRLCTRAILLDAGRVVDAGAPDELLGRYEAAIAGKANSNLPAHVLFRPDVLDPFEKGQITLIEVLDAEGKPKSTIQTWDSLILRVHYRAAEAIANLAINLIVASPQGTHLMNLATWPDVNVPLPARRGGFVADCRISQLPLAAGDYLLTAGLVVPWVAWLCKYDDCATLRVAPADVFRSGFPPTAPHVLLATPHDWTCSEEQESLPA